MTKLLFYGHTEDVLGSAAPDLPGSEKRTSWTVVHDGFDLGNDRL